MRPEYPTKIQHIDTRYNVTEICKVSGAFIVLYKGEPFNLRTRKYYLDGRQKYIRVAFPSLSAAWNLARKLNQKFGTDLFSVGLCTAWQTIPDPKL
jgi:hypothetical protein